MRKKNLAKIKIFFQKAPRALAENTLFSLLGLFLLALLFSGSVFYQYVISVQRMKPEIAEEPLQFQEKTYRGVLKIWETREKNFEMAGKKVYPNPFLSATSTLTK